TLEIVRQRHSERFVGRQRIVIAASFTAQMFQISQECPHVLKVILADDGRIKIEMPTIDLETFEARPTAEVKRQFLGRHRMEQNDFVAVSAQEAKGPSQCIQVIKAIAQQYEQAATFNAAREVRQVGR